MSIFLFPIFTVLLRPVEHGLFSVRVGLGKVVIFAHGSYLWISICQKRKIWYSDTARWELFKNIAINSQVSTICWRGHFLSKNWKSVYYFQRAITLGRKQISQFCFQFFGELNFWWKPNALALWGAASVKRKFFGFFAILNCDVISQNVDV